LGKRLPKKNKQVSVTIPKWVWDEALQFFEKNQEGLKYKNITSPTGWIISLILNKLGENESHQE